MSIESNSQPSPSVETNPFSATPAEIAAREQLFAPDIDYTVASVEHEDTPTSQSPKAESIVVPPQLVDDEAPLQIKKFENNLPKAEDIPQLAPDTSGPRHRL